MTPKQLQKKFNSYKTDVEKWRFLYFLNPCEYEVMLDNDQTFVIFPQKDEEEECLTGEFDHYIGWSDGALELLKAFGITRNCV